jgi:dTDP-4-amino-4,6-dideoxygalactose transaminase
MAPSTAQPRLAPLHHSINLDRLTIVPGRLHQAGKDNIATSVHFIPLHHHPYYRETFGYKPETSPRRRYQGAISLPLYPRMSEADVWDVIRAVRRIVERHRVRRSA